MKKEKKQNKFNEFLDIPREVGSNQPKITIVGFNEVLIENYRGMLEYENYFISISTHIGTMGITGAKLEITKMTTDDILITGRFDKIEFEEIFDETN